MKRRQYTLILKDLEKKMVFIVGPRQVGKTWISLEIAKGIKNHIYLNYDAIEDRKIIESKSWLSDVELIIFDELHKMPKWKNYIKGVYDTKESHTKIIVIGSARLNTFRKTGDALSGRFFAHRLYPLTVSELEHPSESDFDKLLERGGFPEPFLAKNIDEANRWRRQYIDGLIRSDILDFEKIHDFKAIQLVFNLLQRKVGSPISYQSIAEDVNISSITVKKYIEIFEALFIIFRVTPFSKNIARSILKEPKIYFFDSGLVIGDEGAAFENQMALELLKRQHAICDYKGIDADLYYLRSKDKKEIDFCLVQNDEIQIAIEIKLSEKKISPDLKYFTDRYPFKGIQLVKNLRNEYKSGKIEVRKAFDWLTSLKLF